MAFIVETGAGRADATAYIDIAFWDAYWSDRGRDDLVTLGESQKQLRIIEGSDYCDKRYSTQYIGRKKVQTQGRLHPRTGAIDREGVERADDSVFLEVMRATAEYGAVAEQFTLLPNPELAFNERGSSTDPSGETSDTTDSTTTDVIGQAIIEETIDIDGAIRTTTRRSPGETITRRVNETVSREQRQSGLDYVSEAHVPEYPTADLLLQPVLLVPTVQQNGPIVVGSINR